MQLAMSLIALKMGVGFISVTILSFLVSKQELRRIWNHWDEQISSMRSAGCLGIFVMIGGHVSRVRRLNNSKNSSKSKSFRSEKLLTDFLLERIFDMSQQLNVMDRCCVVEGYFSVFEKLILTLNRIGSLESQTKRETIGRSSKRFRSNDCNQPIRYANDSSS